MSTGARLTHTRANQDLMPYSLTETYGPITRLYEHPEWAKLSADELAVLKARQGQSFYAADEALVVKQAEEGGDAHKMVEVKADGKEVRILPSRSVSG